MRVLVNGVHLFFDVEGAGLVPDGPAMRRRPTLLLLHGGPGADHSLYKPAYSALADVAQVVYFDHRGNGHSDAGPRACWTLAQWADDVHELCHVLGIERPIVCGASFGGMVATAYAARYPEHPAKLILISTTTAWQAHNEARVAMFERLGGAEAGALAKRRFVQGDTSPEVLAEWLRVALPLYMRRPFSADVLARAVFNSEVTAWFNRPGGEARSFNLMPGLARVRCPTLVIGGTMDPMTPIECQRDIAAALPSHLVSLEEFADCGHGVVDDAPEATIELMRRFISASEF